MPDQTSIRPTEVSSKLSWFDRFATKVSGFTSKAYFFACSILLILLWLPSYFLIRDVNVWQLIINTATTCLTFMLLALLQNTHTRDTNAMHHKENAIADGLSDFMEEYSKTLKDAEARDRIMQDVKELRAAVGIEEIESS